MQYYQYQLKSAMSQSFFMRISNMYTSWRGRGDNNRYIMQFVNIFIFKFAGKVIGNYQGPINTIRSLTMLIMNLMLKELLSKHKWPTSLCETRRG